MKAKLLLILVLFYFTSFSQVNILYKKQNVSTFSYGGIEKLDNNTFIFSLYGDDVFKVNENGIKIDSVELNNHVADLKAFVVKDTIIYVASTFFHQDSLYKYISLNCFSNNLDSIWKKNYFVDTTKISASSVIGTNDGGFVIIGSIDKGNNKYNGYLLKLDSVGTQQWYHEYGNIAIQSSFSKIVQTSDNGYIIMGSKTISLYNSYLTLTRIDSLGNEIWNWDVIHNYSNMHYSDLIKTQDNDYIVVSNDDNQNDEFDFYTAKLIKFDIDKNITNSIYFPEEAEWLTTDYNHNLFNHFSFFSGITQKENGNYIVINNKQELITYNSLGYTFPIMYELDNNFNIIKVREFRPVPYYYMWYNLVDIFVNNDGSIAMIGGATLPTPQYNPVQQVWFVKTDSNYCDGFGSCDTIFNVDLYYPDSINKNDTISLELEVKSNWDIEYNVFLNYYYKQNGELHYLTKDTLLNILPNQIKQIPISYDILVDKSNFTGILPDSISLNYNIIPSDSISHLNKSSFLRDNHFIFYKDSSINVPIINNLNIAVFVFPNPNKGLFQLKINDKKLKGSKIEIIDTKGEIIKKFEIKEFVTLLNLTKEKKGIYILKVINKNYIESKKIVIE